LLDIKQSAAILDSSMEIHDIGCDLAGVGNLSVAFSKAFVEPSVKRLHPLARRTSTSAGTEARFGG